MPQKRLEISPDFSVIQTTDTPKPGCISAIVGERNGNIVIILSESRNGYELQHVVVCVKTKEIVFEWQDGAELATSCIVKEVWPTREHFFSKVIVVIGDFLGIHTFQNWIITHPQFKT